jgi:hypothetical protein
MNLPMEEKAVQDAILNLMNLCSLMVFCLLTASISQFLDKCFQKGMILRKYYNLICYWFWLPSKKSIVVNCYWKEIPGTCGGWEKILVYNVAFDKNRYQWIFKILGGCIYCFGTWVFICTYLTAAIFILSVKTDILLIFGFMGIGLNYVWLEVIKRIKS